MLSEDQTQTWK